MQHMTKKKKGRAEWLEISKNRLYQDNIDLS